MPFVEDFKKKMELAIPDGLTEDGKKAHETIINHLKKVLGEHFPPDTGGCISFYSPSEWKDRGEKYGTNSVLIVVYDGGNLRPFFNMDAAKDSYDMIKEFAEDNGINLRSKNPYEGYEAMQKALTDEGFMFEECTGWYCAIYVT